MAVEHKLSTSGFKLERADSPEKLAILKSKVQHKIIPIRQYSSIHYVFFDAEFCQCTYSGSEQAYQDYLELVEKEQNEEMQIYEEDDLHIRGWGVYGRGC